MTTHVLPRMRKVSGSAPSMFGLLEAGTRSISIPRADVEPHEIARPAPRTASRLSLPEHSCVVHGACWPQPRGACARPPAPPELRICRDESLLPLAARALPRAPRRCEHPRGRLYIGGARGRGHG